MAIPPPSGNSEKTSCTHLQDRGLIGIAPVAFSFYFNGLPIQR
jgi:hypothetical protein